MSGEMIEDEPMLRVVHEAERERQHARYRIAATVVANGATGEVVNWSLDGLCVKGLGKTIELEDRLDVELGFDFEGLRMGLQISTRALWSRPDLDLIGLQFVDLNDRERSTLRYVIDAFLSGSVVSAGDLIHIVGRENFGPERVAAVERLAPTNPVWRMVRTGFLLLLLVGLVGFSFSTITRRLSTVETTWAIIEAPLVVVRAPQPSYFQPIDLVAGNVLDEGDNVALVELVGGGAVAVDSPCRCSVVKIHARHRDFVGQGEPIVSLLPENEPVYIRAGVPWEDLRSVTTGDRAEIRLASGETIGGRVSKVEAGMGQALRLSSPLKSETGTKEGTADVLIRPDRPLPVTKLDEAVWVTIRTGTHG
jgi:alginate biosynthesis protein Alg44